jgi:type IV fimbrial biogenesis protein FimT
MLTVAFTERGVTLIEFLIGFALLGILVMLAVPSFQDWILSSQVRTTADAINDGLQQARAEAVRRNSLVRFTLTDTNGGGWTVQARNAQTGAFAQILERSAAEGGQATLVAATQPTVDFNGTGWVTPAPATAIRFDVSNPRGGTCQAPGGAGGAVRCLRVLVSAGGQIRMCDPAAPASNPAAC